MRLVFLVSLVVASVAHHTEEHGKHPSHPAAGNTTGTVDNNATRFDDNATSNSNSSVRFPRGTVYQIRPVNFPPGTSASDANSPFRALDSIAAFESAKLLERKPSAEDETTSSSNLKVLSLKFDDSEAVEASEYPNIIRQLVSPPSPQPLGEAKSNLNREASSSSNRHHHRPPPSHHHSHGPPDDEEGPEEPWDASYAFGYTLDDQSRHEVSDPEGNIKGYYQYVDDEGFVRKVVYTAGAEKGFVVLNKEKVKLPHHILQHHRQHHPRKTIHKFSNNAFSSYDKDSIPPPPPPPPSRFKPRPSFPNSAEREDFGFPRPTPISPSERPFSGPPRGHRRPVFVVKVRRPQSRHGEDDDGQYREDSGEDNGQWDGDVGEGPGHSPHRGPPKERPNAAYTFGYETETANRLEKADDFGNVRGSYSYIDDDGTKRTVHYIAGATTGFQVLGSSPSAARSVRIEAPPGFVVTKKAATGPPSSTAATVLSTAESEYPNVIVYHIHPDRNSVNLRWEPVEYSKRPRNVRRLMRIHRRRPVPRGRTRIVKIKEISEEARERAAVESVSDSSIRPPQAQSLVAVPLILKEQSGPVSSTPPSSNLSSPPSSTPFYNLRSQSDLPPRTFRHSTRVSLDTLDRPVFFIRRRPSHRAFTQRVGPNSFDSEEYFGDERMREFVRNDPILHSHSNSQELSRLRRIPIPNPIILQPSKSRVIVRNKGQPIATAESNVYSSLTLMRVPDNSGSEREESNNIFPTPNPPTELFAYGSRNEGGLNSEAVSSPSSSIDATTRKSTQLTISSSTTRIPYSDIVKAREILSHSNDASSRLVFGLSSSSVVENSDREHYSAPAPDATPKPHPTSTAVPSRVDSYREPTPEVLSLTEKEFEHTGVMSSSNRLMHKLGRLSNINSNNTKDTAN